MPLLPRLQLFEFIDQPWLPELLRRGEVDYLRVVLDRLRPYDGVAPQLAELLRTGMSTKTAQAHPSTAPGRWTGRAAPLEYTPAQAALP